jgi:hypothetical protein
MTIAHERTNVVIVHEVAWIPSMPVSLYNNGCTVYAGGLRGIFASRRSDDMRCCWLH